jgi:hypothetical protein
MISDAPEALFLVGCSFAAWEIYGERAARERALDPVP